MKSNMNKVMILAGMKVAAIAVAFVVAVLLINSFGAFGLQDSLAVLSVDAGQIMTYAIIALFIIAAAVFLVSYLSFANNDVILSDNRMLFGKRKLGFDNVAAVNCSKESFEDKLCGKGRISFQLTGLDEERLFVDFVDNPREVAAKIQQIIDNYRRNAYANFADQRRIRHIVGGL
ncbi:MAG: hypothetical protein ABIF10_05035 [Candidatus Woesearchaeota archaeon]